MTVLAVILGIAAGVLSYIPHVLMNKRLRSVDSAAAAGLAGKFFIAIVASFVILLGCVIACNVIAHSLLIPFALGEFGAFVVSVFVLGVLLPKRKN